MKRFSNICFTSTLFLLIASMFAPIFGFEITLIGALINGLLFVAASIFAGFTHKGNYQSWVLSLGYVSSISLTFWGILTFIIRNPNYSLLILLLGFLAGMLIYLTISWSGPHTESHK